MTIRKKIQPRRERIVTVPAAEVVAEPPGIGRLALANRRAAVKQNIADRREAAKQSTDTVVSIPKSETILSDILSTTRNDVRHRRPGAYLHVSDLIAKCMRRVAIIERHELHARAGRLSLMDMLTFRVGDAIHDVVKERATLGAPEKVWGKWHCKCRHLFHEDPCVFAEVDQDDICPHCGEGTVYYEEVPMKDDDLMVVGRPDLLLYLEDIDSFYINELKSISHEQWDVIARPKPEHVLQVVMYWYLMRKLGYRLTDKVSILYVTKGYTFRGSPYKEFVIEVEPELSRLDDFIEEARALKIARENPKAALPARTFCTSETCSDAKKCEVTTICFGEGDGTVEKIDIAALFGKGGTLAAKRVRRAKLRGSGD